EGDFVKTQKALFETQQNTVELPDITKQDPSFNGKVIHATGFADTDEILQDSVFGFNKKAIALSRRVEYYQWTEHSKTEKQQKLGGGEETITTYTYSKNWVKSPVDTNSFHDPSAPFSYRNTVNIQISDENVYAKNVRFGAYMLPDFLIHAIGGEEPLPLQMSQQEQRNLARDIMASHPELSSRRLDSLIHVSGNTLYIGRTPSSPQVGDVRITFTTKAPATISLIAEVKENTFTKFHAKNGKEISALAMGEISMENMFEKKHSDNKMITWILRFIGALLVIGGIRCMIGILEVLASVVPLFGTIVGAGSTFISIVLGLVWSLIIIAIAWLFYRPLFGLLILAVGAGLFALAYAKGKKNKSPAQ
ncbi:MAG: TMEM43 family protein, partial [Desulfovibrio sp.]|nr:TMEM43 family protein [Desulfovibrio sp.]